MLRRLKISAISMALIFAVLFVCNTMVSISVNTSHIADIGRLPVIILDAGHDASNNTIDHLVYDTIQYMGSINVKNRG